LTKPVETKKKLVRTKMFFELNRCKKRIEERKRIKTELLTSKYMFSLKKSHTACTLNILISNSSLPSIKKRKNSLTFALPESNFHLPHQHQKQKVFHLQYYIYATGKQLLYSKGMTFAKGWAK